MIATLPAKPMLSLFDTIAIIIGLVVGASIFETPSFVAANAGSVEGVFLTWGLGGVISLIGALCYAELTTAYPHPGGTYYYLRRSFGPAIAFLFAWTRMSVIQTGTIALLAFIFGDYASQLWRLGGHSASIYAASALLLLTVLNLRGIRQSRRTQTLLAIAQVTGLIIVVVIGLGISLSSTTAVGMDAAIQPDLSAATLAQTSVARSPNWGLVMVFVLLTYGGWNEAAYIASDVRNGRQNLVRALVGSIGLITVFYLVINWALIRSLGLTQMAASQTVVADLMQLSLGQPGTVLMTGLVMVTTIGSLNATIFTGARTNYALGQDFAIFTTLGRERNGTPTNALLVQSVIAGLLVMVGTITRHGFETMVGYTAPAFWFFFLLSGIALFVLRRQRPDVEGAFRVPFYPWTPLAFCGVCVYMLQASLAHTGWGGLLGVLMLLLGLPLLWWTQKDANLVRR
ncbi:MAG: APC family permease [Leptolyngbyaceae cyanobacterium]